MRNDERRRSSSRQLRRSTAIRKAIHAAVRSVSAGEVSSSQPPPRCSATTTVSDHSIVTSAAAISQGLVPFCARRVSRITASAPKPTAATAWLNSPTSVNTLALPFLDTGMVPESGASPVPLGAGVAFK